MKALIRSKITPLMRAKLAALGGALIAAHGKDIQHASPAEATARLTPAKVYSTSSLNKSSSSSSSSTSSTSTSTSSNGKGPSVNVTTVSSTEEFRTTAAELYATFTQASRIAAFTRGPPKLFEGDDGGAARVGGRFEIFGGNVSGAYTGLEPPTGLVQSWRLAQWPQGHFSELEIRFDQNDVDGVTVMRVEWRGVPVGQEEVTRRNWGEYYVRSIKTTFGFGAIL